MSDPLLDRVRDSVIGDGLLLATPFGRRRLTYADYTASGRALTFIEDFIRDEVLPVYANTHTESSGTGWRTTVLREDAREIIARSLNAGPECAVIFAGSGATGAVDRLIGILGLPRSAPHLGGFAASRTGPEAREQAQTQRPVVLVGPYEHHSNELPWRESIAETVEVAEDAQGHVDLDDLERHLKQYSDRPLVIGTFSAASNVTGILTDTEAVSNLLHRYGALAFWDYAAAAPYVDVDMNGPGDSYKDAVFISPHKFVGGPATPGVLCVRRDLLTNPVPAVPGGGTVDYVSPVDQHYYADAVHREEGGTPAIVESIRAGLVFDLKERVGVARIKAREDVFLRRAIAAWSSNDRLELLGNLTADRLAILSFLVRSPHARDRYLHHEFVVSVLSDLFGIQARGGCSCAGPYGHRLLHIGLDRSAEFEDVVLTGCLGIKPGWTRVGFNYFFSDTVVDYVIRAVGLVAEYGHRLLPLYTFDTASGLWRHREAPARPPLRLTGLVDDTVRTGARESFDRHLWVGEEALESYLAEGEALLRELPEPSLGGSLQGLVPDDFERLRWFELPPECLPAS